ncbi:MAG: ABC transporter permease [Anaerolineae bacterium]
MIAFLRRSPLSLVGLILIALLIIGSVGAPLLTPYSPIAVNVRSRLQPPSPQHPLGTDSFGRDVYSRVLYGGRSTLLIGVLVIVLAVALGVPMGIWSGVAGARTDNVIMRVVDAWLAFPALVLAILLATILGPSLQNAMLAVALVYIPQFARVARGQALSVRSMPYIEAAEAAGAGRFRLMTYHVFPNSVSPIIVQATLAVGAAILATASLGFLGLGAQPPSPEWGADVAAATQSLREAPWAAISPGVAILLSVIGFNLIGDGLVEWLNPRTRRTS